MGPRTSANGSSEPNPVSEIPPVPPPANDKKEQSKKFNFGCAECEGQAEHERIRSLLKSKKGKTVKTTLTENPEELSFENVTKKEVWGDTRAFGAKNNYSTLPNARSHSFSSSKKSQQDTTNTQGSQV